MFSVRNPYAGLALVALATALSACGGGSDSASPDPLAPAPTEPTGPDPLLAQQWHLFNSGQSGGLPGADLGLGGLTERGEGIKVAVVDGAVEIGHPDLRPNLLAGLSYNYATGSSNPSPAPATAGQAQDDSTGGPDDAHGTAVAGILLARDNNAYGGRGVAPRAQFMALNPLIQSTDVNMADAMARAWQGGAAVVNNSWGPPDPASGGTGSFYRASSVWQQAVLQGVTQGRGGRGTVYLIAAGNGGASGDDANRDGYANFRAMLTVGAVDDRNRPTSYTEPGANVLVAAPSGNVVGRFRSTAGVVTTDIAGPRGYADVSSALGADHTAFFEGTSSTTPMVAGVVALMLQANPNLSWRDVRWILAATALPATLEVGQPPAVPSAMNSHGFQPQVGFGRVNASAAVNRARGFNSLGAEKSCSSGSLPGGALLPDDTTTPQTLTWNGGSCALDVVEHVSIRVLSNHSYSGDLRISLRSPSGLVSELSTPHSCASSVCTSLVSGHTFGSVRHMGEAAQGNWTLLVSDEQPDDTGRVTSWEVVLYGH
jgi:subtilisin family serine protease